jgi:hypothetical protein
MWLLGWTVYQALAEFMDLDDDEDLATLLERDHIERNGINSLCEYEHVMEPPHPFAFFQQPFLQFDEYL